MKRVLPPAWQKMTAIVLAALVSWGLIEWVDARSLAIADLQVTHLELAPLPHAGVAALSGASFVPADTVLRHEGRFGVARLKFEVSNPETADLSLFTRRVRDNYAVYINGVLASPPPGILADQSTLHGTVPRLTRLLPSQLVRGQNTLDILSARNAGRSTLREVYFGANARLQPAYRHTLTIVHDNAELAAISAGILLLFALALSPMVRPALTLTIAITLGLFLARLLHVLWVNQPWPEPLRDAFLSVVAPSIWIAVAAFINEWTGGPPNLRRWFVASGVAVMATVVAIFSLVNDATRATVIASYIEPLCGFAALAFMTWRLIRHYIQAPPAAAPEIFVACVGLAMACASIESQSGTVANFLPMVQGEAFAQLGAMSIIGFIALGLARHGVGVYQLATLNNETLSRRVEEKERELAANHALLRAQERERDLSAERGRIMRDVHDGIGSQLLGLLVQARNSNAGAMSSGLQAAIDDLYLVIDSLDGVDGSLETALGTFRTRIEPKCAAAGIEIDWQMHDFVATKSMGPAATLQIYRILQEALSNAIRHGRPKRVTFALAKDAASTRVSLSLKDDGKGFDGSMHPPGRGIANMKKRAASIGAGLDVTSDATGTTVKITLPA